MNGKTLHSVQRLPRPVGAAATTAAAADQDGSGANAASGAATNNDHVQQIIQQLIGGLCEFGQNATFNTTNNVTNFSSYNSQQLKRI